MKRIALASPDLSGNEERYVLEAVRSTWLSSTGPFVGRFEEEFARRCGVSHAVAVCNGTAALHLALMALGVEPDDEVIVPALTYVSVANAVTYAGAVPVFADVDVRNWCIRPDSVSARISPKTKGIIAVHSYGHPADMDALREIARENELWIIEDAAEAHFAEYKGRIAGSLGDVGVFSFYGNKVITSGEGGAVTTNSPDLAERIRLLRGQGMDPQRRYFFPVVGYNYRLSNVACAILCAQLEHSQAILSRRQAMVEIYQHLLGPVTGILLRQGYPWAAPTPWLFNILVDPGTFGLSRDELANRLAASGIETRPFFIPLHRLPPYARNLPSSPDLAVSERLGEAGLCLPLHTNLSNQDVERVAQAVLGFAKS